jgi:hypothetical protein
MATIAIEEQIPIAARPPADSPSPGDACGGGETLDDVSKRSPAAGGRGVMLGSEIPVAVVPAKDTFSIVAIPVSLGEPVSEGDRGTMGSERSAQYPSGGGPGSKIE